MAVPDAGAKPGVPFINYTEIEQSSSTIKYQVYIDGNDTTGTISTVTRTIRYKINDGSWVTVLDEQWTYIWNTSRFEITVPRGGTATIEAWDALMEEQSDVAVRVIKDSEIIVNKLYTSGRLDNQFNPLDEVPRSAATVEIMGNGVKITKASSGTGGYTYAIFTVENTDELIGKKIKLSGRLKTSGNFTSGVRLWWMNSANTGISSGPVAGNEYIGNQGYFRVDGYVPEKPENVGKLAVLVYANIGNASQGAYSIYEGLCLEEVGFDNLTHRPEKVYFSAGNYFDSFKMDHQNSTRVIFERTEDGGLKLIKNVTGSTGYTWLCFPIELTDELLNKRIKISGSFETSGDFTSGPRLFWLNTAGTYHTTLVSGFEKIQKSGSFSFEGMLPTRPSNSGKLALYLYANIGTAEQNVYTIYRDVKIEIVDNNLISDTPTRTNNGITTTVTNNNYHISGTVTNTWPSLTQNFKYDMIPRGTPITLSTSSTFPTSTKLYTRFYRNMGLTSYNGLTLAPDSPAATVVFNDYDTFGSQLFLNATVDATIDKTTDIQICKGMNELTGQNYIDTTAIGKGTVNGLDYSVDDDGTIRIHGTTTATGHIYMAYTIPESLIGKTMTMYWEGRVSGLSNIGLKNGGSNVGSIDVLGQMVKARTFIVTSSNQAAANRLDIYFEGANREIDAVFKFYFKEGSCAKPFNSKNIPKAHKAIKIYTSYGGKTKLLYKL